MEWTIRTYHKVGHFLELSLLYVPSSTSLAISSHSIIFLSLWHSRPYHISSSCLKTLTSSDQLRSINYETFD